MNFLDLFPTIDLFILFLFVGAIFFNGTFVKKEKLFIDLLGLYTAFLFVVVVPVFSPQVVEWFGLHPYVRLLAFLVLKFGLLFILWHSNLGSFSKKIAPTEMSTSVVYRIGLMGLFFSTIIYFLPESIGVYFGTMTNFLFGNLIAMLFWFVLPLFFAFAYRFKTRRGWIE